MKIFFADDIDNMLSELRGQAAKTARVHTLTSLNGQTLVLKLYITAFCNNNLYESILTYNYPASGMQPDQLGELIEEKSREIREQFIEQKMRGFEIRKGIYQE